MYSVFRYYNALMIHKLCYAVPIIYLHSVNLNSLKGINFI